MATPFDATTKELVRFQSRDWLHLLGLPRDPCELVDADLATVSTEADRLIQVSSGNPYLVHIEFQAGHDGNAVPGRMLRYNVLAGAQKNLPTLSYVILLRPEADSPALTGHVELRRPNGKRYLIFEYEVIRLWQRPVAEVLKGGLATLPLALLCDLSGTTPEAVVQSIEAQLNQKVEVQNQRKLWASTYLLAGVRFAPEVAGKLLEKAVAQMKESSTYQKILADGRQEGRRAGRIEGERELLLRVARRRLGEPGAPHLAAIQAASLEAIERCADRLLQAETWEELLDPLG